MFGQQIQLKAAETATPAPTVKSSQPELETPDSAPVTKPTRELSNDAWESEWEENQVDLERYIRILNEDEHLAEVVNKGTNLQRYAVEKEDALEEREFASVEDYVANAELFSRLFSDITNCENMLDGIREVVWGFRQHLGSITGDIKTLQQRSADITDRLRNRELALLHLSPVLQKIDVISPSWIKQIESTPIEAPGKSVEKQKEVDMAFLGAVRQLDEKINFLAEDPNLQDSSMQQQLYPQLLATASKISGKLHSFLQTKLESLKEDTNIVIQQQSIAHRCSFAFRFLKQFNTSLADQLVEQYLENMNKVFARQLKRKQTETLTGEVKLPRPDLVVPKDTFDPRKGTEHGGVKLITKLAGIASSKIEHKTHVPFRDRVKILQAIIPDGDQLILDPSIMVQQPRTYVEDFTRLNAALINMAVHEASFISEYFSYPPTRRELILTAVFEKAFAYARDKSSEYLSLSASDPIGIMLLLRISECLFSHLLPHKEGEASDGMQSQLVTSRASTAPVSTSGEGIAQRSKSRNFRPPKFLVSHLKDIQARLWGLYGECIAANVQSVNEASEINFQRRQCKAKGATTAAEMIELDHTLTTSLTTHTTIRRYIDLACDLYNINTTPMIGSRVSGGADGCLIFSDAVVADLKVLRDGALKLLEVLSRRFASSTLISISAINNLYSIVEMFSERGYASDNEDLMIVKQALNSHVEKFTTEELLSGFSSITSVVANAMKSLVKVPPETDADYSENQSAVATTSISQAVETFHDTWRSIFSTLSVLTSKYFQKLCAGQHVLCHVFTKVLEINDSLRSVTMNVWDNPPCASKLVSNEVLKHEITTKYLKNF
eukprot:TRINITY_DN906_c5_g1_i1.p1 TRINITY_DN906_c5_g1~~TRINITY_DN906_c5_g1_i1.p1  ORF type:complete len:894 (+),score=165.28 TRINITY_DN906_c5_g1_i1:171-2684(+)